MNNIQQNDFQCALEGVSAWTKKMIKNALKQEEVEDYIYEFRRELINENSLQCVFRLYLLWAALIYGTKEDMEALYKKGYRYIHKLGKNVKTIETRYFDLSVDEIAPEEAFLTKFIPLLIRDSIDRERYPVELLNEYDQIEEQVRGNIMCHFINLLDERYKQVPDGKVWMEEFLEKMKQTVPMIYNDFMKRNCFVISENTFACHNKV